MAQMEPHFALRARWVFPARQPPIEGGVVTIHNGRIEAVGRDTSAPFTLDLGDSALLPGLVNPHVHLEFSQLAQPIGRPGTPLADWITEVIAWRRQRNDNAASDSRHAWLQAIDAGIKQCLAAGTTTIGEIATQPWTASTFPQVPFTGVVFRELLAPVRDRVDDQLVLARQHLEQPHSSDKELHWGLSPHAPYTVHWELLERLCCHEPMREAVVAMHLGESQEELELLDQGTGPLRDCLEQLGAWENSTAARRAKLLDYLQLLSRARRSLIIHGNYLGSADWEWLGEHAARMSVVYCPRTHHYFRHSPYPLSQMLAAGARVAIGTDGRASSPDLKLLDELRFVARTHPDVEPEIILQAGTLAAAEALGCASRVGSLTVGKQADLAVVGIDTDAAADPWNALFGSDHPVRMTIRRGAIVWEGPEGF